MRRIRPAPLLAMLAVGAACAASAPTPLTASSPAGPKAASVASSASLETAPPPPSSAEPVATPAPAPDAGGALSSASPDAGRDVGTEGRRPDNHDASDSACNEQAPQDFLIRGNFLKQPTGNDRAIQYRTEQYGYFKGFGHPPPGAQPPTTQLVSTTFMGLPVRMHRKVAPALACVEKEIAATCAGHPYTPHALAGIRYRNTYRGGEVTNHAYGIAIDVDPDINTCCGCVPPWSDAPACKRKGVSEYDHMAMPECWVHAFERFGFYWLGHDTLRDTMHFEFLGDPDKIVKSTAHVSAP
jgi:hypothetical protein